MNELESLFGLCRRVRVRVHVELWLEGQAEFGWVGDGEVCGGGRANE